MTRARIASREGEGVPYQRRHSGARVKRANPESMAPEQCLEKWIPGLRLAAHPGMTKSELDRFATLAMTAG
jgi:hypothetical protein